MNTFRSLLLVACTIAAQVTAPGAAPAAPPLESRPTLAQQYQKTPDPELLYRLGILSAQEGKTADALDFLRRYLADPQTPAEGPQIKDAQRRLGELRATAGELLLSGDKGALVLVDGELRGILPLTLPLFLTAGEHVVQVTSGSHQQSGRISIEHGRRTEARFESGSRAVVVSNPPPVAVLIDAPALPPAAVRKLSSTIDRSVTRAGLAPFLSNVAISRLGAECQGITTLACQRQLAKNSSLEYVLLVKLAQVVPTSAASWQVAVRLFDSQVGDIAAAEERTLTVDTTAGLTEMAELIDRVLTTGVSRPRGTLHLTSNPAGATVWVGSRTLGVTPLSQAAWTGPLTLELRQVGYRSEPRQTLITDQQTTELQVELQPLPSAAARRPAWRLGLGIGALASGVLVGGFGAAALSIDGQCTVAVTPPLGACPTLYDTQTLGLALVGVGAGLAVSGVLLVAWPPRSRAQSAVQHSAAHP